MRGGGMAGRAPGGAVRSGGGAMRSGPIAAPRVAPPRVAPPHVAAPAPRFVRASVTRPAGARFVAPRGRFAFAPNRFHHHHRHFFVFTNCFGGFPCFNNGFNTGFGFGWPFYGYSYPYYPSDYYPSNPTSEPAAVSTDNANEIELARAVQRLSDEIEELRNEQRRGASPERTTPVPSSSESMPARATFVLRDGHHLTAQNYAIAGQALWIIDEHQARKIDLADVDRSATEQLNAANGVDLKLP